MRHTVGLGLAVIVMTFFAIYFFSYGSAPATIPPYAPPPPPPPPSPTQTQRYTEVYVSQQYQVQEAGRLPAGVNESALKSTQGTPGVFDYNSSTTLGEAVTRLLSYNASQISPQAFYAAANLAGYANSTAAAQTARNVSYLLYPVPVDDAGTQPDLTPIRLVVAEPPNASPGTIPYPPSASLDYNVQPSYTIVGSSGSKSGNTTVTYYTVQVEARIPYTMYSSGCIYADGVKETCANQSYIIMEFTTSTAQPYSLTQNFVVKNTVTWDGKQYMMQWDAGQATLKMGIYKSTSKTGNTTHIYYLPSVTLTGNAPTPPQWVKTLGSAKAAAYRENQAQLYLDGENLWYSIYSKLWSTITQNTSQAYWVYRPFELAYMVGGIATQITLSNQSYTGNPYEKTFFAKTGNQTAAATIPLLIEGFQNPFYRINGEVYTGSGYVAQTYAVIANVSFPDWITNGTAPYLDTLTNGYSSEGAIYYPTQGNTVGMNAYWLAGSTAAFQPLPQPRQTYEYTEYYMRQGPSQPFASKKVNVEITEYVPWNQ